MLGNRYLMWGKCHHIKETCSAKCNSLNEKSSRITENHCHCWKRAAELCRTILSSQRSQGDFLYQVSARLRIIQGLAAHQGDCRMANTGSCLCVTRVACPQRSYYIVPGTGHTTKLLCVHITPERLLLIITPGHLGLCHITDLRQSRFFK